MPKKQAEIPGAERPSLPEVDSLVIEVLEKKEAAKEASDAKKDAEEALITRLVELGLESYTFHDGETRYHVIVGEETKVKVQPVKERRQQSVPREVN